MSIRHVIHICMSVGHILKSTLQSDYRSVMYLILMRSKMCIKLIEVLCRVLRV
jgi:hypothetical protein